MSVLVLEYQPFLLIVLNVNIIDHKTSRGYGEIRFVAMLNACLVTMSLSLPSVQDQLDPWGGWVLSLYAALFCPLIK